MNDHKLIEIIIGLNYLQVFLITISYFLFLYFIVGFLFNSSCKFLEKRKFLEKIQVSKTSNFREEIRNSILSIFIFGFSGVFLVLFVKLNWISFENSSVFNVVFGVLILMLWNEIHFFIIHRLLHIPFLFKKVHYIHHKSKIPSVYTVYSFHWIEAFLLSTVPLFITPFYDFSIISIALFPLMSILFNFAGHCNYRFGKGMLPTFLLFGTKHNTHHSKNTGNYSFITSFLDIISTKIRR
jgi:sterol desaturase/sphingolipid hydroxylase (fatty acid hydroxylase superfamily)